MTQEAFDRYLETAVESYAQSHIRAGDCEPGEALELAQADYASLLPQGLASEGQHLYSLFVDDVPAPVGMIWFAMRTRRGKHSAFIYDFEIDAAHRGKGYGKSALAAAEALARSLGATRIGLNVMGYNTAARALYEKAGFEITGMGMVKKLPT